MGRIIEFAGGGSPQAQATVQTRILPDQTVPAFLLAPGADAIVRDQSERDATAARAAHLALLHPARSRGQATLMSPTFDGSAALRGRQLATAPEALAAGYVSLQRHHGARKGDDLAAVNAFAWADVEIGPSSPFHGQDPEDVAGIVLERLDEAGVPRPSYCLFSGRGLWLVWLAERALPARVEGRVRRALRCLWGERITTGRGAVEERVLAKAARLAAIWDGLDLDRSVGDMARVHRVAGSINAKSGERVRLVWPASWTDVQRQDFEAFADSVMPFSRQETEAYLAERQSARGARQARAEAEGRTVEPRKVRAVPGLHGVVEQELMTLATHLGPARLKELRLRDMVAFHVACARARAGLGGDERSWAADLAPIVGLTEKCLRMYLKPVSERLRRHEAGETVEYRGRQVSPLYTHRIDRIVADLGIDAALAQAAGLVRLVPDVTVRPALTAAERQAQVRRRNGVAPRTTRTLADVASLARELTRDVDLPVAEIARLLGCGRATVYRAMETFPETTHEAVATGSEASQSVSRASRSLSGGYASERATASSETVPATPGKAKRARSRSPALILPQGNLSWDPVERLQAMIHYQIGLVRQDRRQAGAAGFGEDWQGRERQAVRLARELVEIEVETGQRAFPRGIVPDRLSGNTRTCSVRGPLLH